MDLASALRDALDVSALSIAEAEAIDADLHRAGRQELGISDEDANAHRQSLRQVLRAWCVLRPTIGYVQAMNQIAAAALVLCDHDEFRALSLFIRCLDALPSDFFGRGQVGVSPALAGCVAEVSALVRLAEQRYPSLFAATTADSLRESLSMVATQWYAALWVGVLPVACLPAAWGLLLDTKEADGASDGASDVENDGKHGDASSACAPDANGDPNLQRSDANLRLGLALVGRVAGAITAVQLEEDDEEAGGSGAYYEALLRAAEGLEQAAEAGPALLEAIEVVGPLPPDVVAVARREGRAAAAAEVVAKERRRAEARALSEKRGGAGDSRGDPAAAAAHRRKELRVVRGMAYVALSGALFSVMTHADRTRLFASRSPDALEPVTRQVQPVTCQGY